MIPDSKSTKTNESCPKVTILLLNYNGWKYAVECLESVYRITYPNWEVLFVDNGSTDDSVSKIKEWAAGKIQIKSKFFEYVERKPLKYVEELFYDEEEGMVKKLKKEKEGDLLPSDQKLSILRIEKNRGFVGGNNVGLEYVLKEKKSDYILTLSNDLVVNQNFLMELVKTAKSDEKVGIVQTKMLTMDNPRIINSTGHIFKFGKIVDRGIGEVDNGQYDDKLSIIGACAGASLYKKELFEDIGLFDRSFFMYYEDAELSWRAFNRGWKARFAPRAIVYHKIGGSGSKDKIMGRKMGEICLRNMGVTVRRYGTLYQKFLFSLFLLYTGIKSGMGEWIGRNIWGYKPYAIALKELWNFGEHR